MPREKLDIIREDIKDHVHDRLQVWLSDSLELYKMGGQRYGVALCDVFLATTMGLLAVAHVAQLSKEEILQAVDRSYDLYVKTNREQEESR